MKRHTGKWYGVMLHHTAGNTNEKIEQIRNYHIYHNKWGDIGYHYVINIDTESNAPSEPVKVELEERPVEEVREETPSNAVNEINNVEQNNVLEQPQQIMPQENVAMPVNNVVNPIPVENVDNVENSIPEVKNNSKKKILTIVVVVLTIALGILVGWLLFKLSQS